MLRTLLVLVIALSAAACVSRRGAYRAGPRSAGGIPAQVVALAAGTKPGGSFFIEFDESGRLLGADSEVAIESVPAHLVEAANARYPGGEVVGAEHEWADGRLLWEVNKVIDGENWEILVGPDGKVIGGEQALSQDKWPANVVSAAVEATGGGTVDGVEHVWGPEAQRGEYYHVKIMKDGDSLRVGVDESGKVVRVVRRVPGQVRVPR